MSQATRRTLWFGAVMVLAIVSAGFLLRFSGFSGQSPKGRPPAAIATGLTKPDRDIALALRGVMPREIGRFVVGEARTAIERFYIDRGFAPLWIENGAGNARQIVVTAYLRTVGAEGLDPEDYLDPDVMFAGSPKELARAELKFTAALLRYVRHARNGRIAFRRDSPDIAYQQPAPNFARALQEFAGTTDIAALLAGYHPSHAAYQALKRKLAELREQPDKSRPESERVIEIIIANLERWRWMPRDLGRNHVIVNIPDFTLKLIQDGSLRLAANVIVGNPTTPTPVFTATMTSITVNPIWNIPPSMVESQYLPALRSDPHLLQRLALQIERKPDGTVRIFQLPGQTNVLGNIRFNLPNRFLVYQHDTPDQDLFSHPVRAYSHGCVRVENPLYYAEALLGLARPPDPYPPERLWKLFGSSEVEIPLRSAVPVHHTYQTAYVADDDQLVLRRDLYGHDASLLAGFAVDASHRDARRAQSRVGLVAKSDNSRNSLIDIIILSIRRWIGESFGF